MLESIKRLELIKRSDIDVKKTINYYKTKDSNGGFNDKYIDYRSKSDENISIEQYLEKVRPCMSDMIDKFIKSGEWKIQPTISGSFISSKDMMINNLFKKYIEIMIGNKTDEIIKPLFQLLLTRYPIGLETSMKGSDFVFDSIDGLYYKCLRVSLNRGGLYIYSPNWIKNKRPVINRENNGDTCFQYAVTVALNDQNNLKDPQRISKPFIDNYN